jgi:hypothetical protein
MLLSAFTGTSFSTAMINGFSEGLNIGSELQKVIETAAATIPEQVSATWLNVSNFSKVEPMVLESRLICRSVYDFLSG